MKERRSPWEPRFRRPARYDRPPRLRQSNDEVDKRLARYQARREARLEKMPESVSSPNLKDFQDVVKALDWCYRRAIVKRADKILQDYKAQTDKVRIMTFEDPAVLEAAQFEVEYRKHGAGGSVFVKVKRREGFKGLLAVSFPPGTYGRPYVAPIDEDLYGDWPPARRGNNAGTPKSQDLVFLAARIAWLDPDVNEVELRFPVSCGRFHKGEPRPGDRFLLVRFEEKEPISRLAIEVCALSNYTLNHAAAQMAIWIVRDKLTWRQYINKKRSLGPSMTFETARVITDDDAIDAADLLIDAGIDPRTLEFYATSSR